MRPEVYDILLRLARAAITNPEASAAFESILGEHGPKLTRTQRSRVHAARSGHAGLLVASTSRETGTVTGIYSTLTFEGPEEAANGKYTVVCEDHSTCVLVDTMAMAKHTAAHPTSFCDDCRDAKDKT